MSKKTEKLIKNIDLFYIKGFIDIVYIRFRKL